MNGKLKIRVTSAKQGHCAVITDIDCGYSTQLWSIWAKQLGMKEGQEGYLTFIATNKGLNDKEVQEK